MSTKTICDFCADEHGAITRKVTIDREKPFLIDACQDYLDHLRAHAIPEAELVTVAPAGVETPQPEIPAALAKPAKSKKKTAASTEVAVRPASRSRTLSASSVTARKNPQDHPCPFCPDQLTQSGYYSHIQGKHGFKTPKDAQGPKCPLCNKTHGRLTNHAKEDHAPLTNAGQLFAAALEAGDPHGIVAKRRKAATNVVLP